MRGPLSYIGGKNRLAKTIIALIPPHKTYIEPFFGGGQVLFHKEPSEVEIVNDLSHEIVNFFRICQHHYQELVRYLEYTIISRHWFELYKNMNPEGLTDVQRAARFFYLQKNSFGGLINNRHTKLTVEHTPNFNPAQVPQLLEQTHQRLQRVQIECLPYQEILARCDRPETFFYLDPPYWNKKLYEFNFSAKDFNELAQLLKDLKGQFILSLNDVPEVREIFSGFHIQPVSLAYSAANPRGRRYAEVLITNF